jgi:hypothetical protein
MDSILNGVRSNLELLSTCLEKRDGIFRELKDDLMIQYVEKRNREEEVRTLLPFSFLPNPSLSSPGCELVLHSEVSAQHDVQVETTNQRRAK